MRWLGRLCIGCALRVGNAPIALRRKVPPRPGESRYAVIPAKAGIHFDLRGVQMDSGFRRNDGVCAARF